jgi:hypothetical protein
MIVYSMACLFVEQNWEPPSWDPKTHPESRIFHSNPGGIRWLFESTSEDSTRIAKIIRVVNDGLMMGLLWI